MIQFSVAPLQNGEGQGERSDCPIFHRHLHVCLMQVTYGQRVSPVKLQLARKLRREMTGSERALWQMLRRNALGLHFRRQQVIGGFIADFYCAKARLAVEVDGPAHARQAQDARKRDRALRTLGVRTVRVTTRAIEQNIDAVLRRIVAAAQLQT